METTKQSRGLWWLAIGLGVLAFLGQEYARSADVRVNIGPPPIVVPAPPAVVLIPGSAVYFVPYNRPWVVGGGRPSAGANACDWRPEGLPHCPQEGIAYSLRPMEKTT